MPETGQRGNAVIMGLNASIVAVIADQPHVLTIRATREGSRASADSLPFGQFDPQNHRTLELGVRSFVTAQTTLTLGYVEQLYTFGDRGRHVLEPGEGPRVVSVGYLALTRADDQETTSGAVWRRWYDFFPWEDWRGKRPAIIDELIRPRLEAWAGKRDSAAADASAERARLCFAFDGLPWDEEKVLERYELMYEAGLVLETRKDRRALPASAPDESEQKRFGEAMQFDHRRILATAMGRLRGKLKYRPVVFELMPPAFTLLDLQRTVESIIGIRLHKQNFRRLVAASGLVEPTGRHTAKAGGRPAEQYRFRHEVLRERPTPGVKISSPRTARA